jgi:hypothetical protein
VAREAKLTPPPEDVTKDCVAWSLTGETEMLGEVTLKFGWERKIGELEIGGSTKETLPRLLPRNVDRAWGQIVIAKAETLDVRPDKEPEGLRQIDPQHDLMPGVQVADAARAFEFHDQWGLELKVTRYEMVEVKRTSIERAVVRMEVTRSNRVSVQALYRVRSAQQRLPVILPADVEFDTEPLRINGRSASLERGDQQELFIPLTGQNAETPFVVEIRYTAPGTHRRLDLPNFETEPANKPALQKIYLCAYIPRELTLLGSRGPWTDEMVWRWYEPLGGRAEPKRSDRELVAWVIEGLGIPDPTADFATDGRLYTYSTLQPAPPPAGSLRLVAVNETYFHVILFALVTLAGLVLIAQPLTQKVAAVALLVAALLVAGVVAPTFSRQILDGALFIAVLVVACVWLVWYVAKGSRSLARWWSACCVSWAARPSAKAPAAGTVEPPATVEAEVVAGSPFSGQPPGDRPAEPSGPPSGQTGAEPAAPPATPDSQEGGRSHG